MRILFYFCIPKKLKMSDKNPIILVPIGFSEQSITALEQAIIFAESMQADITLLSVLNDDAHIRDSLGVGKKEETELKKKAKAQLEALAAKYSADSGLTISSLVAQGVIYEEINRVVELIEADMVVMGTNGKPTNLAKRFIGSNAYRTATTVKVPVVTIKGVRKIDKIETIIFPLILGNQSKEKVGAALHYARLLNATVKVVGVVNEPDEEKMLRGNINQVVTFIQEKEVNCTGHLITKPEHKGVIRNTLFFAYENDGDLLMITENDFDRDITEFFLGTDVQAMIYHSEIPVMSITPRDRKWGGSWSAI